MYSSMFKGLLTILDVIIGSWSFLCSFVSICGYSEPFPRRGDRGPTLRRSSLALTLSSWYSEADKSQFVFWD